MIEENTENELKYLIEEDNFTLVHIIDVFLNNEYKINSISEVKNSDTYYDTKDFQLLNNESSLRIREKRTEYKKSFIGTYKSPAETDNIYSSRIEIEKNIKDSSLKTLLTNIDIPKDYKIEEEPILNILTKRINVVFSKKDTDITLSYDKTFYTNLKDNIKENENMLEIEIINSPDADLSLNKINKFIKDSFSDFKINKQSKYERGVLKTLRNENINQNKKPL